MGQARALLATPDRAFQEQLARRVVEDDLSVRTVEEAIREHDAQPSTTTPDATPAAPKVPAQRTSPAGAARARGAARRPPRDESDDQHGQRAGQGRGGVLHARRPRADLPLDDRRARRPPRRGTQPLPTQLFGRGSAGSSTPRRIPTTIAWATSPPRGHETARRRDVVVRRGFAEHGRHARLAQRSVAAPADVDLDLEHRCELGCSPRSATRKPASERN